MRKIFTTIVLLSLMVVSSHAQVVFLRGDANGDGVVDISDVVSVVNLVLNGGFDSNCPDDHHPHAIDLGLPSGTKWACCNVGATAPEDYGSYFAWGETKEKSVYDWSTYTYCDGTQWNCYDIGSNISATKYDAAYVKWGSNWQMPTYEQFKELQDKCKDYQFIYINGTSNRGLRITGPNGNKIILPAGGSYKNGGKQNVDKYGDYWAGKPHPDDDRCAYVFFYHQYSGGLDNTDGARCNGCNIRPVTK